MSCDTRAFAKTRIMLCEFIFITRHKVCRPMHTHNNNNNIIQSPSIMPNMRCYVRGDKIVLYYIFCRSALKNAYINACEKF